MATSEYVLTDAHRAQLPAWRDRWLKNALSCDPMTEYDREQTIWAVDGLYKSVNLTPPKSIVFVPSPFLLRFASGFAAALIYMRDKKHMTLPRVEQPELGATGIGADIIRAVTAAINPGPSTVIPVVADEVAMKACSSTDEGRYWYRVNTSEIRNAAHLLGGENYKFLLSCAAASYRMWQGGNQWSAWVGFLSFYRDVVGAKLPHDEVWPYWYAGTVHSGPRIVHPDFAMISDRPSTLLVDDRQRPHSGDGPFCTWRDGSALYAWHGQRLPRWVAERKDLLTVQSIDNETNAETRRAMIEIFTSERYIREGKCVRIHEDQNGILWHRPFGTQGRREESWACVEVINGTVEPDGTHKHYFLQVPPDCKTATEAVAWTYGMSADDYSRLTIRT